MLKFLSARSLVAGSAFAAAAAFGTVGGAATVKILDDGVTTCTYGATGAGVSASTDCDQASPLGPGGNTTITQMNEQDIFTIETWSLADKINLTDIVGEYLKITFGTDLKSGTWSLLDGLTFTAGEFYAIALKSASDSFVYLLDTTATSGTWSTVDLRGPQGQQQALSNITLFGTSSPAPIPLPATGLLLIAALGGLGLMRRRAALA